MAEQIPKIDLHTISFDSIYPDRSRSNGSSQSDKESLLNTTSENTWCKRWFFWCFE